MLFIEAANVDLLQPWSAVEPVRIEVGAACDVALSCLSDSDGARDPSTPALLEHVSPCHSATPSLAGLVLCGPSRPISKLHFVDPTACQRHTSMQLAAALTPHPERRQQKGPRTREGWASLRLGGGPGPLQSQAGMPFRSRTVYVWLYTEAETQAS